MTIRIGASGDRADVIAATGMSQDLFEILVCPVDKQDLQLDASSLVCTSCGRRYSITDGIPDMLVDEQAAE